MKKGRGIVVPALKRPGSDSETRSATRAADTAGVGAATAWVVRTGVNRVSGLPEKAPPGRLVLCGHSRKDPNKGPHRRRAEDEEAHSRQAGGHSIPL